MKTPPPVENAGMMQISVLLDLYPNLEVIIEMVAKNLEIQPTC